MNIDEKRIYDEARERTVAYVATGQGLASVELSGDQVGRFGLAHRGRARDVAAGDGIVYAVTEADVVAGPGGGASTGGENGDGPATGSGLFGGTGFGGGVAVAFADAPLAADGSGWVSRYGGEEWSVVGSVEGVREMDGDLVAAAEGVYRVGPEGLDYVGLDDVRDVAAAGVPLAATGDGLYRLGNGWQRALDGEFTTVAADGRRAHAATAGRLYAREEAGEWRPRSLPVEEPVADVAYGECVYVVTGSGTVLVDADPESTPDGAGGWRSRSLGLTDVAAMVVPTVTPRRNRKAV
jgi:hypothetical protein